jgi:hypothetical protein
MTFPSRPPNRRAAFLLSAVAEGFRVSWRFRSGHLRNRAAYLPDRAVKLPYITLSKAVICLQPSTSHLIIAFLPEEQRTRPPDPFHGLFASTGRNGRGPQWYLCQVRRPEPLRNQGRMILLTQADKSGRAAFYRSISLPRPDMDRAEYAGHPGSAGRHARLHCLRSACHCRNR